MIDPRWLLRMSQWARNPPSTKRVIVVFAIIAAALAIGLIEWLGYWPDWATAERIPRRF
ncbi:hypothetical protein DSM110093_01430 [Sulfitobacter sp. DSM 110093]|uniref:hypothetical protein n=1 Tax=Sulfitobacter sp. DSM 110093 TaxID=2883127 RepID=UPI001FAC7FF2|nr:hypothetical protein [Sulfitobacter sp. DSM 110093]UOA31659.1 hypothetical protein DSM110093_01430 [Sulfitobacter sp. DSM 110093]